MEASVYIKAIGALFMVLGLLFMLIYCLRKCGTAVQGRGRLIEVIETRMILPRRHICLVKVGARVMVLASSERGIQYLGDMEEDTVQVEEAGSDRT